MFSNPIPSHACCPPPPMGGPPPDPGAQPCCGTEQRGLPDICKLSSRLSGTRAWDPDQGGKGGAEGREDPALPEEKGVRGPPGLGPPPRLLPSSEPRPPPPALS